MTSGNISNELTIHPSVTFSNELTRINSFYRALAGYASVRRNRRTLAAAAIKPRSAKAPRLVQ